MSSVFIEELVDKNKREKLWKIYYGKLDPSDDLKQAERIRIKNIRKQLSTINRNQTLLDETVRTPRTKSCLRRSSSHCTTYLSVDNQQRDRRRSSLDLQIIGQWKSTVDQNPFQQRVPWPIKKVLISRQFHQNYKRSTTDSKLNLEHCAPLIEVEKDHLLTRNSRESSNPYVTYFHLPLVTMRSSHQIIQIDHDDNQMLNFSKV